MARIVTTMFIAALSVSSRAQQVVAPAKVSAKSVEKSATKSPEKIAAKVAARTAAEGGDSSTRWQRTADRIAQRSFPSVFQAWSPADNMKDEEKDTTLARHDLVFGAPESFRLIWSGPYKGLATTFASSSLLAGRAYRQLLHKKNPNLIMIAEIRYRDAIRTWLPIMHNWWKRDTKGKPVMGWEEGGYCQMNLSDAEFRQQVAAQCKAVVASGVFDGVMLDWWEEDDNHVDLAKAVREAVGDSALILVNSNDRKIPRTAPYINGCFMECFRSKSAEDWKRIQETLEWNESHLREPRIVCLETWWRDSREDLNLMRATTALALTRSNGYCLFSDPNTLPTSDHLHNWYPFWEPKLGKPLKLGVVRPDGACEREFENGFALYNPMGNKRVKATFDVVVTRQSNGQKGREFELADCDGEIFLKESK
ncbi:MAG: putative glycoside hydrolase [Candidatus Sumerlaeota bacterium]|nr:putative glycoside hydrolase [Candidatus Sumerlaeota bacterium]